MAGRYVFTCGSCAEEIVVDDWARQLLRDSGCAVCSAEVTEGSFAPVDDGGSR
ncbi:MAG: hypothetical protein ABEJ28_12340 [Salinigranum sp.]